MGRVVPLSLLNSQWRCVVAIRSSWCRTRLLLASTLMEQGSRYGLCRCKSYSAIVMASKEIVNWQIGRLRGSLVASRAHSVPSDSDSRCKTSSEGFRLLTTNVTVNLIRQTALDVQERQTSDPGSSSPDASLEQRTDSSITGQTPLIDSTEPEEHFAATVTVSHNENLETKVPTSQTARKTDEVKWWHIPDSIEEVLPLPAHFEERVEVLFKRFGSLIDSRELLLRVLVHKSYYDQKVSAVIKDQEYVKPDSVSLFVDAGEVQQHCLEGLPSKSPPCMTFADAHGEVRSQLALLGDAVINLAVSALLVRQYSSAGAISERRSQLVSNSNLSRVWKTLLGPQDFVLIFGDSSLQLAAQTRLMADACEAYIGAIYSEKGFDAACNCVTSALFPFLVQADSLRNPVYALHLQCSMAFQVHPEYRLIGVDNKNTTHQVCRVRVYVKGLRMATGLGQNQKLARVDAARKALEKWPIIFKAP